MVWIMLKLQCKWYNLICIDLFTYLPIHSGSKMALNNLEAIYVICTRPYSCLYYPWYSLRTFGWCLEVWKCVVTSLLNLLGELHFVLLMTNCRWTYSLQFVSMLKYALIKMFQYRFNMHVQSFERFHHTMCPVFSHWLTTS